ncbi:MAG: DUF2779 domain-containing protein [Hyphomicrobiaceae bacterium]
MQLSKSDYLMFLKHPAWLWLKKNRKEVIPPPNAALQALFDAGHEYEQYAEQLFPDGVKLGFDNYREYQSLPQRTLDALSNGANTIFQGRFEHGQTTCIVDVLQRAGTDAFDLFEIKASTSVKPEHIPDLSFQVSVLEGAGITVRRAGIVHVDRDYVRQGAIDVTGISMIEDVTDQVAERKLTTLEEIGRALAVLDQADMPDISPRYVSSGNMSEWMEIYANVMGKPDRYSIYNLAGIKPDQIAALEDEGIHTIDAIPDDANLTERQLRQVGVTKTRQQLIKREEIKRFLSSLTYPLYFLDYETFSDILPPFDGLRPYQQVPFQYSLHVISEPGARPTHCEYLHVESCDPVPSIVSHLRKDIGDAGSVIVWYAPFEKGRNQDMAARVPEHAPFLESLNARVIDLMIPFKSGWFVDKDFLGSASIKKVLPVLVPELTYEGLAIGNGEIAQRTWMDLFLRHKPQDNPNAVLDDLRRYCELDTLAMVRIFEKLLTV